MKIPSTGKTKYIIVLENISGAKFTELQVGNNKFEAIKKARDRYNKILCLRTKSVFPRVYSVVTDSML